MLGFSRPASFAVLEDRLFIPSGNGVIISQKNEFHFWQPTQPQYEVTHVCTNKKGILCLADRKLSVSLYFFYGADLRLINDVIDVATSHIDDLAFSLDNESLFVLCSIPTRGVKILRSSNGKYIQVGKVPCGSSFNLSVFPTKFTQCNRDFLVVHTKGFTFYGFNQDDYEDCISCNEFSDGVSCAMAVQGGVLVGSQCGHVFFYDNEQMKSVSKHLIEENSAISCNNNSNERGITSMCFINDTSFIATESGKIFKFSVSDGSSLVAEVKSRIHKLCYPGYGTTCYVGAESGIFRLELVDGADPLLFTVKMRSAPLVKCLKYERDPDNDEAIGACTDGSFLTFSIKSGNITYWRGSPETKVLDACLLSRKRIILTLASGEILCLGVDSGRLLWSTSFPGFVPMLCESNLNDKIVFAHRFGIGLVLATPEGVEHIGKTRVGSGSGVFVVHWLPDEDRFLVVLGNGEVHLFHFPSKAVEFSTDLVAESIWRLDLPLVDFVPLYSEPDVINILAHSVDKDTKLYALERRRDGDTKIVRPLFLMRDHESGGACLRRFDETTILSGGKDGKIILRDVDHYQVKLAAIPPSKEKRKPLFEKLVRPFSYGGIRTTCAVGGLALCGSAVDGAINIIPISERNSSLSWREVAWNTRQYSMNQVSSQEISEVDLRPHIKERDAILKSMEKLQEEWKEVMSTMDVDVPIDSLLIPERQAAFNAACDRGIAEMKEEHEHNMLLNQFVQYHIKKNCWETMAVIQEKVVSLTDLKVEVHNFHLLKKMQETKAVANKVLFLREIQNRIGQGHRMEPLRNAVSPSSRSKMLHSDEFKDALYTPFDVYTHTRAVIQSIILQGRILSLKTGFNQGFNELKETKKMVIAQIEERNRRCAKIVKQLGEQPGDFFVTVKDPEEDPLSVFDVSDEELPEEAKAYVVKKSEITIVSPSNEAALKLWMDCLEKDVDLLEVQLPPPDFADETKDSYVQPEERTEEQAKQYEDYEKKLKEEIEQLNIKKEGLRNEFMDLQKESRLSAAKVEESLNSLRYQRLIAAEEINECEMRLGNLLQQLLRGPSIFRNYETLDLEKHKLERTLKHMGLLVKEKKEIFEMFSSSLLALSEMNEMFADEVKSKAPFNDCSGGDKLHRRFLRWKRKFDDGKATLDDAKKPDDISDAVWESFFSHCKAAASLREELLEATSVRQKEEDALKEVTQRYEKIKDEINAKEDLKLDKKASYLRQLLDTYELYSLYQGQIQDETCITCSDFSNSCLRWVSDVDQFNDLIMAGDAENASLLERIIQRRKLMKFLKWETERLNYCVGTLEIELRQLHTLRVTRQMQEWLSGDAQTSEKEILDNIDRHIRYVHQNMSKKVQDLVSVAGSLKSQMSERVAENEMLKKYSEDLRKSVEDKTLVKKLVDVHADGSLQFSQRAQEIYETSELEELARSQQEELIRLKREADRLRERTFPSFAVVSKKTI